MIRLQRVAERASTARSGQNPPQTPQAKHRDHSQARDAERLRAAEERTRTIQGNTRKNRERQGRNSVHKTNRQVAGGGGHPLRLRHRLRGHRLGRYWLWRVRVRGSGRNLLTVLRLLIILGIRLTVSRLLVLPVLVLLNRLALHRLPLTILTLLGVLPIPAIRRITILVRSRHRFLPLAA